MSWWKKKFKIGVETSGHIYKSKSKGGKQNFTWYQYKVIQNFIIIIVFNFQLLFHINIELVFYDLLKYLNICMQGAMLLSVLKIFVNYCDFSVYKVWC